MKRVFSILALLALVSMTVVACSDDDNGGESIEFDNEAFFFAAGETRTLHFTTSTAMTCTVSSIPKGWGDPVVNDLAGTITITAPAADDAEAESSGNLILRGYTSDGTYTATTIFISVTERVDLSGKPANSYLLNSKNTNYTIDVSHEGNSQKRIVPASVKVIWQSVTKLISYLALEGDKVTFFVGEEDGHIKEGNALIGAYDAAGKLLWSWHLWAVDYDPDEQGTFSVNNYEMMTYNLGALDNSTASGETILKSYGLYYQWGRKDPFIGPSTYQMANGYSAAMYDPKSGTVSLEMVETSATVGTVEYANLHPLVYLTGSKEVDNDWMWNGSSARWSEQKSVSDPCPYGWKVAPAAAFAGLSIADPLTGVADGTYDTKYGWTLTDGSLQALFMGAGRRVYTNGKFQNVYVNSVNVSNAAEYDQPWIGLYWTSDATARQASAFSFYYNKRDVEQSRVEGIVSHYRANGMPVRCVRE